MVVGSLGYAKLLQPALDQKDSGARSMLYGQSRADPEAKPGTTKTFAKPEIKMRTLEEEYERSKKQWKNEYEIKPVPRPADAPKMREKGEHSL